MRKVRDLLLAFWRWLYNTVGQFCERYLYAVPIVLGTALLAMFLYLCYATIISVNETNETIRQIPTIIQVEMEKTRIVMVEGESQTVERIKDQHRETRDELQKRAEESQKRAEAAERNQKAMKAALAEIDKRVNALPKRQKVLGIF